jgi:hypothetical protein
MSPHCDDETKRVQAMQALVVSRFDRLASQSSGSSTISDISQSFDVTPDALAGVTLSG